MPGGFVDSNVLIYAFTTDARAAAAQAVLEAVVPPAFRDSTNSPTWRGANSA
jgi:predicted nucleic acid-binding protein